LTDFVFAIKRFFQTRDELSLSNIRRNLWPLWLTFPLTVILGDARYFNMNIAVAGFESYELLLYPLGLGWLVLVFVPERFVYNLLKVAAICCAALLPFQFLLTDEIPKLAVFMAFQFLNGICAGCAFSVFCFKLNNIERFSGIAIIIFYYSLYYSVYRAFPAVQFAWKTWGSCIFMAFYLVAIFLLGSRLKNPELEVPGNTVQQKADELTGNPSRESKMKMVIGLHIVYYSIMCMINYIEGSQNIIYSLNFGLGQFSSIVMVILIMLIFNRNALYVWLIYLVFTLLGMSIVNYDSKVAHELGSYFYGFGDGSGYIIMYYLCAGAIKKSKSFKVHKLFCMIIFIEYFIISGIFSRAFALYEGSYHTIALGVVLALCSFCFFALPFLQKRLFEADWTDGLHLKDMAEYTQGLADTDAININDHLNLTEREHEIFTMLLKGMAPKEIAHTLKISYPTVNFHIGNLYRKLRIQSRAELFAKYKL
jgi:DNA-binding CsgD family transcriptional regulator